jgi:hypothetical protein
MRGDIEAVYLLLALKGDLVLRGVATRDYETRGNVIRIGQFADGFFVTLVDAAK